MPRRASTRSGKKSDAPAPGVVKSQSPIALLNYLRLALTLEQIPTASRKVASDNLLSRASRCLVNLSKSLGRTLSASKRQSCPARRYTFGYVCCVWLVLPRSELCGRSLRFVYAVKTVRSNCSVEGLIVRPPTLNNCKWCPEACLDIRR